MASEPERSMAAILRDIVGNVQMIVAAEIRLAGLEVRQEAGKAKRSVVLLIVGSAVSVLALAFVLLSCVYLLATVVAPWIASLIAAAAAGAVGAVFIAAGIRQMRQVTVPPPKVRAALEENFLWAKAPAK
jgi:uncharacterized membrane protein YqjE